MKRLLVFLGVIVWSVTGASADMMTFDAATVGGHPPYTEAGMTVTTVDGYGWEPTFFAWGGGIGLHMEGGIVRFDMGGSPFDLDELFYTTLDGDSDNTVTFSNGGTHTFVGGYATDVVVDLTGVSAAKDLSWFTITLPDINFCSQLDYVAFTPVPLPASVILAYAGLATASLLKRRLRR